MRNWIDSKDYDMMLKASFGISLPIVIVTIVMLITGEPISVFERKTAIYILIVSSIVFLWAFISLLINLILQIFKPAINDEEAIDEQERVEFNEADETESIDTPAKDYSILKSQFMARFVTEDHKKDPIYEVIGQVLNEKKEGAFAARVIGCASEAPLNWLTKKLSSREMIYYFGVEAIHSETSYNGGLSKFRKNSYKEDSYSDAINIMKDKLKELQNKKLEELKGK